MKFRDLARFLSYLSLFLLLIFFVNSLTPREISADSCCTGDPSIYCGERSGWDCYGGVQHPDNDCYVSRFFEGTACYACTNAQWLPCFCTGLVPGLPEDCRCGRYTGLESGQRGSLA